MTFLHLSLLIISLQGPWPAEEAGIGARISVFAATGIWAGQCACALPPYRHHGTATPPRVRAHERIKEDETC
jgi:hypothetical protein